jgi:hypothetical protein
MKVGIIFAYMDTRRRSGTRYRGPIQPMTGTLIAALLPPEVEVEVINDNSPDSVDWSRDYDLLFISSIHSDFDRAKQISHYWRRRGAKTVYGGFMASTYSHLCQPFFDAIVVGDAEGCLRQIFDDFCRGELKPLYVSSAFDASKVPVPRFDLLAGKNLVPLTFETTRGCPFTCDFCALTSVGTRYHTLSPEQVVHTIKEGQRMLEGLVPWYQRRFACFVDNNIGGNPSHLLKLCEALAPLNIRWGSQITFNVLANLDAVKAVSRAGCRAMFMGLESFNPETIADMHKYQNTIDQTKTVLEQCRRHGVLVGSGLMLSPVIDDCNYIQSIPSRLKDCGFYLPAYICFESPIPGTPHFHRLAAQEDPAFLPNALLRDFSGYTLVVRPKRESVESFIEGYKWLLSNTYSKKVKLAKFADDLPRLFAQGWWLTAVADIFNNAFAGDRPQAGRTYLAGTDTTPPEAVDVPFTENDFESEDERRAILEPFRVTDERGHVLPAWTRSVKIFEAKGRVTAGARQLVGLS